MLTTFSTRHVRGYMEKNEETTMEEKVKQNGEWNSIVNTRALRKKL